MNFSDKYGKEYDEYEEMEIDCLDEDLGEVTQEQITERLEQMNETFVAATVNRFIRYDHALRDAGYEDKDERLRIIEIIF